MNTQKVLKSTLSILVFLITASAQADNPSPAKLLRLSYHSSITDQNREYFVYLPVGYDQRQRKKWPVILFLHGHGQRGNGLNDLDYVLVHGPLMEAWIQHRPLPFIIISPQLPLKFSIAGVEEYQSKGPKPARLKQGVPERNYGFKSDLPIKRLDGEDFPKGIYSRFEPYPRFGGWINIDRELISILNTVINDYHANPFRVYLTGISYGGFGTFDMAARYPFRWAAIAPIAGTGKLDDAAKIAEARLPVWMFAGGKDTTVKPHWLYQMAEALESAGHAALRFTVHEDMDHDAWKRVYEGEYLYNWFMRYTSDKRP